jgi:hypothetical protein
MTPRISLRPAGAAAVLITFVAVVLTLLSVTGLTLKHSSSGVPTVQSERVASSGNSSGDDVRHSVKNRPGSTASPASHRSSVQTSERRITAAALGQGTEIHYPGGSPDVPAALSTRGWNLLTDLVDLPVDASAEVIATTVSVAHRGRAPPVVHGV